MKRITIVEVETVSHNLAKKLMDWDEPIPPFSTRYHGKLESCLATPFQTYNKKAFYRTLVDKAAILFYLMIKNHPFKNGNKRIAVTTLLSFLAMNNLWLEVDEQELYQFAMFVARSPAKYQKGIVNIIKEFIAGYKVSYKKTRISY